MRGRSRPVVRPVKFANEAQAWPRAVRSESPSLAPGTLIEVEVGATFQTVRGREKRVPGQWVAATVDRVVHSELHVHRLTPS